MKELSIIVTSYKNPQLLKVCLDSLRSSVRGVDYEMIVAEGEAEEATELMMMEDFPEAKFFPFEKNVGLQVLLKKCIEESSGRYLLMLNGDIIIKDDAVAKLLKYIKDRKDVGLVGPKLLNFDGSSQVSTFRFYKPITIIYRRTFLGRLPFAKKHLAWFQMEDVDHEKELEADWIMGSALMTSREALEKVGLMDKRFFLYMEDVDWCRRFWENNYKVIYFPGASMHHYHGKGSAKGGVLQSLMLNKYTWIHISSAVKYFYKYLGKNIPHR